MDYMDFLIENFSPFQNGTEVDRAFFNALNESFDFHYANNELFRKNADFFEVKDIYNEKDLIKYPFFFVDLFKSQRLCSIPGSQIKIRLCSSGTGGRKSYHYLDEITLNRIIRIVRYIFSDYGLVNNEPHNYLCFTYDPKKGKNIGTAFSDKLLTKLTKKAKIYYALEFNEQTQNFEFNELKCLDILKEFELSNLPLRILGFPAYIWQVLSITNHNFSFPKTSAVISGGGWKLHTGQEVAKPVFKQMIAEKLGIQVSNIYDTYGMVEHGIPYLDCEYGKFHVPVYSKILVREPLTLKLLPTGKEGLLQLITPYMHALPAISLLTTDKVIWGLDCKCQLKTPYFEIRGRAGIKKHKGCAINAAELLGSQTLKVEINDPYNRHQTEATYDHDL